jgi:hypothetical protein
MAKLEIAATLSVAPFAALFRNCEALIVDSSRKTEICRVY